MTYRKPSSRSVAIANGATTSGIIDLRDSVIVGIITPATLTSIAVTFSACDTLDGTFMPVYDATGTLVSVVVAASRATGVSGAAADALAAWNYIKVVMGSAEGGARTLVLALK